jgi:hypothetical protein
MVNKILNGNAVGLYVAERLARYDRVPLEAILHGMPSSLHKVLRSHPNRWPRWAVAAVCNLESLEENLPWEDLLDRAEEALGPILNPKTK